MSWRRALLLGGKKPSGSFPRGQTPVLHERTKNKMVCVGEIPSGSSITHRKQFKESFVFGRGALSAFQMISEKAPRSNIEHGAFFCCALLRGRKGVSNECNDLGWTMTVGRPQQTLN